MAYAWMLADFAVWQGVRVSVATCGSISLKWSQPADTSPVIAYEVLYKRPSQTEPPVAFALNGREATVDDCDDRAEAVQRGAHARLERCRRAQPRCA